MNPEDAWIGLAAVVWAYLFIAFSTQLVAEVRGANSVPAWALRLSGGGERVHGVRRVSRLVIASILTLGPQLVALAALLSRRAELGVVGSGFFFAELALCASWVAVLSHEPVRSD